VIQTMQMYMLREEIGSRVKNTRMPVKKIGLAPTILCFRIVMLCSA
jgi:hypothetical protein